MGMNMTLDEKDALLAQVIGEHLSTQKTSPFYVPVVHIESKGLDLSDTNNSLWRLKDNEVVEKYKHCWGFFEVQKSKKKFVVTSSEAPQTDEDIEVYEVEASQEQVSKFAQSQSVSGRTVLYLNSNGDFYREPKESFCYETKDGGVPNRILKYFANNPNTNYEQNTEGVAVSVGIKTDQLRKEINKMRSPMETTLKIKERLFESRSNKGYRLNPNIEILLKK
jgi:hypothetical protein